jgi:hypothetical protein
VAALSAGVDGAVDAPPPVEGAGVLPLEHAPTTTARLARPLANFNFVFTWVSPPAWSKAGRAGALSPSEWRLHPSCP